MRILFLHRNFPGQFVHLAKYFAQDARNRVVFITERKDRSLPGVLKAVYTIPDRNGPTGLLKNAQMQGVAKTHPYLRFYEEAILHGQAAARAALDLKKRGFTPDIIIGHTWGQNLFMKDVFPETPLVGHFEWFYRARGSDVDFDTKEPLSIDTMARVRIKNAHILNDLYACDYGICPTQWQYEQFPPEFQHKIKVTHEGISTDYFKPDPDVQPVWPGLNLDLSHAQEIVTYVSRGLEPYRGFPQFMEAAALILNERPGCHIVIVGADKVFYGSNLPNGKTYKQAALEKLKLSGASSGESSIPKEGILNMTHSHSSQQAVRNALTAEFTGDQSRLHFTGYIPYDAYRRVLQVSSAHVYLTYPFVLSWSMLEAMSTECLVLASDTPPVKEVIRDGVNGILFNFFSPEEIAKKVCYVLMHQDEMTEIRKRAREMVLEKYDLKKILPEQVGYIGKIVNERKKELSSSSMRSAVHG